MNNQVWQFIGAKYFLIIHCKIFIQHHYTLYQHRTAAASLGEEVGEGGPSRITPSRGVTPK